MDKKTLQHYQEEADRGDADAQAKLGLMRYDGRVAVQHYQEALKWFQKAAEQGHADAMYHLGRMYENGQGTPKNNQKAVGWYRKAAEQGHACAQLTVGSKCVCGEEYVEKDLVRAHMWFNLAAAGGSEKAAESRNSVEQDMESAQIAEAQDFAWKFEPKPHNQSKSGSL